MLSTREQHILDELAAATAAADRRFVRRMSAGPYGRTAARWRAGLVIAVLLLAVATEAVVTAGGAVPGLVLVVSVTVTVALMYGVTRPHDTVRAA